MTAAGAGGRVGDLRLRIRTDLDRPGELRTPAEAFVHDVLARVADALEAKAPGRVVCIRRLSLAWRLSAAELDEDAATAARAHEVAERLADVLPAPAIAPRADAEIAVFTGRAQQRAAALLAAARGRPAWFGDAPDARLADLAADPAFARAVLAELASAPGDALPGVLAAAPPAAVTAVAERLGATRLPGADATRGEIAGILARTTAAWRPLSPDALGLALVVEARRLLGTAASDTDVRALAGAARSRRAELAAPAVVAQPAAAAAAPPAEVAAATIAADAPAMAADEHAAADQPAAAALPSPSPHDAAPSALEGQWGGMFYWLNALLELDVAALLWRACLPEGPVIAAAIDLLSGGRAHAEAATLAGDPGAAWDVSREQLVEIAPAILAEFVARCPWRGLATLPAARLALHVPERRADAPAPRGSSPASGVEPGPSGERVLCLAPLGTAYPLFAWPAGTPAALRAGLDAVLAAWPASVPLHAPPALAAACASPRVATLTDAVLAAQPRCLFPAQAGLAAALVAQVAGAPAALLAARLAEAGGHLPDVAALAAAHLARPVALARSPDALIVRFPDGALDLAIRRCGMDRDPGAIPWLGCTARLAFESVEL